MVMKNHQTWAIYLLVLATKVVSREMLKEIPCPWPHMVSWCSYQDNTGIIIPYRAHTISYVF